MPILLDVKLGRCADVKLLEDLHTHTGAKVRFGGKMSKRFCTSSGVRQGCVLAPALFCIAIDWILGQLTPQVGITVGGHRFTDLDADDAVVFLSSEDQAAPALNALSTAAAPFGLRLSWAKTKVQKG